MATKRKKKGDIDLVANFKYLLHEIDPEGKLNVDLMKEILAVSGPNAVLAALSKEQREGLLRALQRGDAAKRPSDIPQNP